MKKISVLLAASALLYAGQVQAATVNVDPSQLLSKAQAQAQSIFENVSDDLSAATWMTPGNSAEAHSAGIIPVGVQAAIEVA
ncbi:MAG: hypothetical protein R8M46_07880, partial [Ghiorsea sp.]